MAALTWARWKAHIARKSHLVRMSALTTKNGAVRRSRVSVSAPIVPSGRDSSTYSTRTPRVAPSPRESRIIIDL